MVTVHIAFGSHMMSDAPTPTDVARWRRLLVVPNTGTNELYDPDQGIRPCILRAFGFHDEYLSYSSSSATRSRKRLKGEGKNWSSVSRVWESLRRSASVKLIQWTFASFKNQLRFSARPSPTAHDTHARGVFIDKSRSLFLVYEPKAYQGQHSEWFGKSLNDFARLYRGYQHIVVYGNQEMSTDCEKRTLRFGMCCWEAFRASHCQEPRRDCSCGLRITHTARLYIRK